MGKYQSYKPSGIEWIGEIPEDWNSGKMKYVLSNNDGGVWGSDVENEEEGTLVVRSTEITIDGNWDLSQILKRNLTDNEVSKCKLFEGDIVITKSSGSPQHIGKSVIVSKEIEDLNCCYSNFVQRIRFKDYHPKLYHYILNSEIVREQFKYLTTSSTGLGNLNGTSLNDVLLPFIPLTEQQQIVKFLDEKTELIDKLISTKERKVSLLKEQRTSLINHVVTKGLNPNVKLKDSGVEWIGEIPELWEIGRLGYYSNVYRGSGYQYLNQVDEEYNRRKEKVVRISDITEFNPIWCEYLEQFENYRIRKDEILIGGTGHYFGKSIYVTEEMEGLIHSYNIIRLVVKEQYSKFIQYYISSPIIREQMDMSVLGSGQPFIDLQGLKDLTILIPKYNEQLQIVEYLDCKTKEIDDLVQLEQKKIDILKEYRQSLISEVVTGKIKVTTDE